MSVPQGLPDGFERFGEKKLLLSSKRHDIVENVFWRRYERWHLRVPIPALSM